MDDFLTTLDHRLFDLAGNHLDEVETGDLVDVELTDLGLELVEFEGATRV